MTAPNGTPAADAEIIFLSYRRDDSRATSGRLHDRLVTSFGPSRVFQDVTVPPGASYPDLLRLHLERTAVLLVVIGPNWAGADATGNRRIDDPGDWVRREVEAALAAGTEIVPVLVDDAQMPPADALPESIRPLTSRIAALLHNDYWAMTFEHLAETIGQLTGWPIRGDQPKQLFGTPPMIVNDIRMRPEFAALQQDGPKVITAMHGIGGVGKSQLAAVAFARLRHDYDNAAWIDMRQGDGRVGYEQIARVLELDVIGDVVEAVRNHLTRSETSWLLVYDNADSPRQIEPLLPRGGPVKIIITSRYRSWGHLAEQVDLDVFPPDEAVEHLCGRAGRPVNDDAVVLAEALGHLPLALSLAGAFCAEQQIGFDRYRSEVLPADLVGSLSPIEGGGYDKTIDALWRESLRSIGEISPEAVELIGLLSLLDWARVERSWLADRYRPESTDLNRLLALLGSYSLIDLDETGLAIKHNLLADGIASDLDPTAVASGLERLFRDSLEAVEATLDASLAAAESVRHLQRLLYDHPDRLSPALVDPLFMAGEQLLHEEVPSAEYHHAAAAAGERLLGPDHNDTLMLQSNVALALWHAGRYKEAVTKATEVFADCERVLGPDSEETMTAGSVLGAAYASAGRLEDAAAIEEEVLSRRGRVLGPDHPDTINCRANLASTYSELGRYDESIELGERTLADRVRLLGDRHPDTLTSRANLAATYGDVSRYEEALRLEEEILADRIEVLGPTHPETLHLRGNLARSHRQLGDIDEAIAILEELAELERSVLGPDHPQTLSNLGSLALFYGENDRLDEAIPLNETVVRALADQLGDDHHEVLTMRANQALLLAGAKRFDEAVPLAEEVAGQSEQAFGSTHPDTLSARSNLGSMYSETGRVEEAIVVEEEVADLHRQVLGDDHHRTLIAHSNLAVSYVRAGRRDDALRLWHDVVAGLTTMLGPDHPDTISIRERRDKLAQGAELVEDVDDPRDGE